MQRLDSSSAFVYKSIMKKDPHWDITETRFKKFFKSFSEELRDFAAEVKADADSKARDEFKAVLLAKADAEAKAAAEANAAAEVQAAAEALAAESAEVKAAAEALTTAISQIIEAVQAQSVSDANAGAAAAGDAHPDATRAIYDFICGKRA